MTYEDYLKELEIRFKDLVISFQNLTHLSKNLDEEAYADEAGLSFLKCKMMLETLAISNPGFMELLEATMKGIENRMKSKEEIDGLAK